MMSPNTDRDYERYARMLVRSRVVKLARPLRLQICDLPDLEQEILIYLYQRLPLFDPNRGSIEAFTNQVVTSKIRNILSHQTAKLRDFRLIEFSIDETVPETDGDYAAKKDLIDAQVVIQSRGDIDCYTHDQLDLKADIDRIIDQLPAKYADLCRALKHGNATDAATELGINRREVTRRIQMLRRIFNRYWSEPDAKKFAHFLEFSCK